MPIICVIICTGLLVPIYNNIILNSSSSSTVLKSFLIGYTHSLLNFRMLLSYYNIIIVPIIRWEKFEALKKSACRKHLATSVQLHEGRGNIIQRYQNRVFRSEVRELCSVQ